MQRIVTKVFFGAMALVSQVMADEYIRELEPSTEPIHVRVQFEQNPAHEAVVSWTTTAEGESHVLYICEQPRDGDLETYTGVVESQHTQPYTLRPDEEEAGMRSWTHNIALKGLEPATRYYLTVVSDGKASEEFYFKTAPADGRDIRLLAVGDSRIASAYRTRTNNPRRGVNRRMGELFEEYPDIIAVMHGGDYTNHAYWGELYWWLKDHTETTTTSDNRLLPIIPARGNHDMDIGFEEMFWWPNRENNYYYTTQLNDNAALITLNTMISRGGDQKEWLEAQLAKLRPKNRWLLAMYHHPAYPSARSYRGAAPQREAWVPLFEQYGLDTGYESHDHALKRTHPIFEGEINEDRGIVYFGDGGGGVHLRRPDVDRWYVAVAERYHHAHLLTFTEDALNIQAISSKGTLVDDFTLTQDRRSVPQQGTR